MHITKENIHKFIEGTTMDCSNMDITYIEYIPETIIHLYCGDNRLTELPNIPHRLRYFDCSFNNLPYEVTLKNLKEHNKLIKRKEILSRICV